MAWKFAAEDNSLELEVPYLEDARESFAPYYASSRGSMEDRIKILGRARDLVITNLSLLGGGLAGFQEGSFTDDAGRMRIGYNVFYFYGSNKGVLRSAGLPMKGSITDVKLIKAKTQALFIVADWLKSAITAQVFSPGMYALIPFLLVDGEHTITEKIILTGSLPLLGGS